MATTGVFNFMRLKEGCDPANAFESYEQDPHTMEVRDARLLPQDADILQPSSAGFMVVPARTRAPPCLQRRKLCVSFCKIFKRIRPKVSWNVDE